MLIGAAVVLAASAMGRFIANTTPRWLRSRRSDAQALLETLETRLVYRGVATVSLNAGGNLRWVYDSTLPSGAVRVYPGSAYEKRQVGKMLFISCNRDIQVNHGLGVCWDGLVAGNVFLS
jgi:hypothetical protein